LRTAFIVALGSGESQTLRLGGLVPP